MGKLMTLALLLLFSNTFCFAQERRVRGERYEEGKAAAAEDVGQGRYVIKVWGLPSANLYPWPSREDIYQTILKETYKVSLEWVGGCVVDEVTSDYADGYNEVATAGIKARYGKGVFEKARRRADAEYEKKYGARQREQDKKFNEGLMSLPAKPEGEND
jgi:hypothetical protein